MHALILERIESAVTTADTLGALEIIRENWETLNAAHGLALRKAMDRIPGGEWESDPWLVGAYASSYHSVGSPSRSAALPYFEAAIKAIDDGTPRAEVVGIRLHYSAALRSLGQFHAAAAQIMAAEDVLEADDALPLLGKVRLQARLAAYSGLITQHLGAVGDALTSLRLAIGLSEHLLPSERAECLGTLAIIEYMRGDFREAVRDSEAAEAAAPELHGSRFGAAALVARVLVASERDELALSETLMPVAVLAAIRTEWEPMSLFASSRNALISTRYPEGLELLRRASQSYESWRPIGIVAEMVGGMKAALTVLAGNPGPAWDVAMAMEPTADHSSCPARFIARLKLGSGDAAGAIEVLEACDALGDSHASRTLIDVLAVRAAAHDELGNLAAADLAFDRAVLIAEQTGIRVPFRLLPDTVVRRLVSRAIERPQSRAARSILGDLHGSTPVDELSLDRQLTERERELLRYLNNSMSTAAIADALYISVNTVKSHVRSIYRKLGVGSKTDAIRRARELGIHFDAI